MSKITIEIGRQLRVQKILQFCASVGCGLWFGIILKQCLILTTAINWPLLITAIFGSTFCLLVLQNSLKLYCVLRDSLAMHVNNLNNKYQELYEKRISNCYTNAERDQFLKEEACIKKELAELYKVL